jgi:peptide/nickel transport system substrate-binding protein
MLRTLGVIGGAGLAGCSSDGESTDAGGGGDPYEDTDTPTETDTEESTGTERTMADEAIIALPTDLTAGVWNVYGGVMPYYSNVLEPLIWVTDDMGLEPWLATDWEATSETTWEFTLREDVTFHNGEPMTADDVVFSFEQILNEWAWAPGWLQLDPEGSVTAVDETTVEFTTRAPLPSFPGTIAHNMVAVQHQDRDRDANEVIGTGPFQVVERQQEQYVQTEAFDDYWNEEPNLESLRFRVITDPNTRALSLTGDEVDVAYQPPKNKVSSLEDDEDTQVYTQLEPSAGYAGLNIYKSPTDDVDLRRALNYAVPQELIIEEVLDGIGKPAKGPIADQ